jgi:hypothetical protein
MWPIERRGRGGGQANFFGRNVYNAGKRRRPTGIGQLGVGRIFGDW